jgi:hypothetical protein
VPPFPIEVSGPAFDVILDGSQDSRSQATHAEWHSVADELSEVATQTVDTIAPTARTKLLGALRGADRFPRACTRLLARLP